MYYELTRNGKDIVFYNNPELKNEKKLMCAQLVL